jgi:hypothetical protein
LRIHDPSAKVLPTGTKHFNTQSFTSLVALRRYTRIGCIRLASDSADWLHSACIRFSRGGKNILCRFRKNVRRYTRVHHLDDLELSEKMLGEAIELANYRI